MKSVQNVEYAIEIKKFDKTIFLKTKVCQNSGSLFILFFLQINDFKSIAILSKTSFEKKNGTILEGCKFNNLFNITKQKKPGN